MTSAIEKIEKLIEMITEFFKKIYKAVDEVMAKELGGYEKMFVRELNSIKDIFYLADKDLDEFKKNMQEDRKINNNSKANIENRLKRLKYIMEYAQKNMDNINLFLIKTTSLIASSKKLNNEINIKLDRKKDKMDSSQLKMNRYYDELNKLNSRKHFLENEIYRSNLKKEQIKEKVKDLSIKIFDEYSMPVDYIIKNFKQPEDVEKCEARVKEIKAELTKYKNINPNAHIEYEKIKERFDFLDKQKNESYDIILKYEKKGEENEK